MELIDIIFSLLKKFVPMDSTQYRQLKTDALKWREVEQPDNKVWMMYDKFHQEWYMRLFFAIMYIPAVKWVLSFMEAEGEDVEL